MIPEKPKILVVEDESIIAMDIENSLRSSGYEVVAKAASGGQALELMEQHDPDLVLMDIVLKEELDGIETADLMRPRFNIPVIFLTAYADDETLQRAKLTEPFGYLVKPFEDRELHTCIEMALYKHKQQNILLESRNWLFAMFQGMGDAVVAVDENSCVTFLNPVAEALTGWKEREAAGKPLNDIIVLKNAKTGERMKNPATQALRENIIVHLGKDVLLVHRNGAETAIGDSVAPIKDNGGKVIGGVLIFQDITEAKKAEAESERSNRDLQEFAYLASHDMRVSLRKASSFAEILRKKYGGTLDQSGKDCLDRMQSATMRMERYIESLLNLTDIEAEKTPLIPTDLNTVVAEVVADLEIRIKKTGGRVVVGNLPTLNADGVQMRLLFHNLISNALRFQKKNISPIVRIAGRRADFEKETWKISIEDNGAGFDVNRLDRVLKPFAHLSKYGELEGAGLGLAICQKIVERHKGTITAESSPQGATFIVTLPGK